MQINISVNAVVELVVAAPALLQVQAREIVGAQITRASEISVDGKYPLSVFDLYENPCQKIKLEVGANHIAYSTSVDLPDARSRELISDDFGDLLEFPAEALHFLLPSRYCPSDRCVALAEDMFGHHKAGFGRVQSICQWINEHVAYQYGTSDASTSGLDTLICRQGVCRDFAHLAITLCRALNIPARYVSGYCLGLKPPDFHAFFQAYLGGRWVSFDATELQPRPALIAASVGRDAADCAWCTIFGMGLTKDLHVDVKTVDV